MSLTKATYSLIQGAPVNVLDFGAVGDGIANDTVAIQAAIDSGADSIFIPEGIYLVDGLFEIGERTIFGGGSSTVLRKSADGGYMFSLGGSGSLMNLEIDLNSKISQGVFANSIYTSGTPTGTVSNVNIYGSVSGSAKTITGISVGTATVVTSVAHGFSNGDFIEITNVVGLYPASGQTESVANRTYRVYNCTADTFTLYNGYFASASNTTGYSAYVSGGTAVKVSYAYVLTNNDVTVSPTKANHKFIDLVCKNNYGHILSYVSVGTIFNSASLIGNCDGYALNLNFATNAVNFDNIYLESGITVNTGIRGISFNNTIAQINSLWTRPFFYGLGLNSAALAGGELSGISFTNFRLLHTNTYVGPSFLTNAYEFNLSNVTVFCPTANWVFLEDWTTFRLKLNQITVDRGETTNPWEFITADTNGGIHTTADNIWFTQGIAGLCTWGRGRYSGTGNFSFVTVRNSNLNHTISATGLGGSCYIFEQIKGDVDLTNAVSFGNYLYAVSGTVTAPEKARIRIGELKTELKDLYVGNGSVLIASGAGSPELVVNALPGSLYLRTDGSPGTNLYIKETGVFSGGWVAKL